MGLPSIAISLASWDGNNFETAGKVAKQVVDAIHTSQLSHDTVLNVNVPDINYKDIKGFQTTRLGKRHISEQSFKDKDNPNLLWIGENGKEADNGVGTDFHAINNNYVSVTPLQIDLTKYNEIDKVSEWIQELD